MSFCQSVFSSSRRDKRGGRRISLFVCRLIQPNCPSNSPTYPFTHRSNSSLCLPVFLYSFHSLSLSFFLPETATSSQGRTAHIWAQFTRKSAITSTQMGPLPLKSHEASKTSILVFWDQSSRRKFTTPSGSCSETMRPDRILFMLR